MPQIRRVALGTGEGRERRIGRTLKNRAIGRSEHTVRGDLGSHRGSSDAAEYGGAAHPVAAQAIGAMHAAGVLAGCE